MKIENSVVLQSPVTRVWKALTDPAEFSAWFNVLFVEPFVPGKTSQGKVTYPGYEGMRCDINVLTKDECRTFAFSWHPHAIDTNRDYSSEPLTLVEFRLAPDAGGTHLSVLEEGFEQLPAERAKEAYEAHVPGWELQLGNIAAHLGEKSSLS